jgi:hypothetical protein
MKLAEIQNCRECPRYNDFNSQCFHPKIRKPHPEGYEGKQISLRHLRDYTFPEWCPLENSK